MTVFYNFFMLFLQHFREQRKSGNYNIYPTDDSEDPSLSSEGFKTRRNNNDDKLLMFGFHKIDKPTDMITHVSSTSSDSFSVSRKTDLHCAAFFGYSQVVWVLWGGDHVYSCPGRLGMGKCTIGSPKTGQVQGWIQCLVMGRCSITCDNQMSRSSGNIPFFQKVIPFFTAIC